MAGTGQAAKKREDRKPLQARVATRSFRSDPSNVITLLRDFIEEGKFEIGMTLPPERVLAERLGVGRPAIREGIKALSILDVLESRRGAGTYVKSLEGLKAGWPATVAIRSTDFKMLDLLEVRKMLEPAAAKLAASRADEDCLRRLDLLCTDLEAESDWDKIARNDLALHNAIIEGSGNPVLIELDRALGQLQRRSRRITGASAPNRDAMIQHHRCIVNAILRGEGETAEKAMLEHLHQVGLDLISKAKR